MLVALALTLALVLWERSAVAAEPPPIVILLVDTVRADCLRPFNPTMTVGDQISRLARDGIVFESARATSSWTRTSVATLLTGLPERVHKVYERGDVLAEELDTLPERLATRGYRSAAWSANPNVLRVWGFAQGFGTFVDVGATTWPQHKAHARELLGQVVPFVRDNHAGPWLYYVHFMDAHSPYQPEAADLGAVHADARLAATFPARGTVAENDAGARADYERYLAEIIGLDRQIGVFLDELRGLGIYDRSAILLVADHGEEFLEHGGIEHGKTLYEEMLRVPAVLKLPQQAGAGTRVAVPVGMADFLPTLLAIAGAPVTPELPGVALWDGAQVVSPPERPLLASLSLDEHDKRAVAERGWKLIEKRDGAAELFQLAEDPRERSPRRDEAHAAPLRGAIEAADAEHQEGWHLRLCRSGPNLPVAFRMSTTGTVRGSLLEPNDTVQPTGSPGRYAVKLSLRKEQKPVAGREVDDEDEVWIGDGAEVASVEVRGRIRYALGSQARVRSGDWLQLDASTRDAEVRGPVSCRNAVEGQGGSYLRVWHVPPAEQRPEADVDPAVRERMRALGY